MAKQERFNLVVGAKDKSAAIIKSITKNIAGMAAAFLSFQRVTSFLTDSVRAAKETQKAYTDLSGAVSRAGESWEYAEGTVRAFTKSMQEMSGFSDEEVAFTLQRFLGFGMNLQQAMRGAKAAIDLAVHGQRDLAVMSDALGKTFAGNASALSEYAIYVDQNATAVEKYAQAIEIIEKRAGGAAAKHMENEAAQLDLLALKWSDLTAQVGDFFLQHSGTLVSNLQSAMDGLQQMLEPEPELEMGDKIREYLEQIKELNAELEKAKNASVFRIDATMFTSVPAVTIKKIEEQIAVLEGLVESYQLANNLSDEDLRWIEFDTPIGPPPPKQAEVTEAISLTNDEIRKNLDLLGELLAISPGGISTPWLGDYTRGEQMQGIKLPTWDDTWLNDFEDGMKEMSWATNDFVSGAMSSFQMLGSGFNEMVWGMRVEWSTLLQDMLKMLTGTLLQMGAKFAAAKILTSIPFLGITMGMLGMARPVSPTVSGDALARQLAPSLERLALTGHSRLAVR